MKKSQVLELWNKVKPSIQKRCKNHDPSLKILQDIDELLHNTRTSAEISEALQEFKNETRRLMEPFVEMENIIDALDEAVEHQHGSPRVQFSFPPNVLIFGNENSAEHPPPPLPPMAPMRNAPVLRHPHWGANWDLLQNNNNQNQNQT